MSACLFCGETRKVVLETHHVVPRRYGGSDASENLITVCSNCHSVLESVYDDNFYGRLGHEKIKHERDVERGELKTELRQSDLEGRVEKLKNPQDVAEKLSAVEVEEMILSSMEEVADKVSSGRVYDAEKEEVRQGWVKRLSMLARAFAEVRSKAGRRYIRNNDQQELETFSDGGGGDD